MTYLWDTNVVIYYLQQQLPLAGEKFIDNLLKTEYPAISVISEIELLGWKSATEKDTALLLGFIEDCLIMELENEIKLNTIKLRKASNIKLPDAVIAATAMTYNLTLLTRNISDFEKIDELKVINPWNL